MARSMLKGKRMSHKFWGEVVPIVVCILNKCLTKRLGTKTPEEAWFGRRPNVRHLIGFGSLCFRHVSAQNRRKLDYRAENIVLLGYDSTRAYKVYVPNKGRVVISRDILVDESIKYGSGRQVP